MARPLASLYPASYGYGKKPRAIDDEPDYMRKDTTSKARPVVPAIGVASPDQGMTKPSSSATPQAIQDQMVQQNMQRRATAFDAQQDGYAQADRNAKAIYANNVANSQAGPSRDQDYQNIMRNKGMPQAVAPAAPMAPQASNPNMQPPAVDSVMLPRSPFDTMPAGSGGGPVSGPVPVPAVVPYSPTVNEGARLAQNPSVAVSGPAQDAQAIQSRVQAIPDIQNKFGGDVGAYQRAGQVQAANAQMARPQAVAPPNPVDTFGQMRTKPTVQATAPEGSRLATLRAEASRGQQALDTGSSLEQQKRDADIAAQRKQQVDVATAANPPRTSTAGTASQPKPDLPPEVKARVQSILTEKRKSTTTPERSKELDAELERVLDTTPRKTLTQIAKDFFGLNGKPAGEAAPSAPVNVASEAEASKLPKGTIVIINGRRAIVE